MSTPKKRLKLFFKHPPDWICDSPSFDDLDPAMVLLLHVIMGQCETEVGGGSVRGGYIGDAHRQAMGYKSRNTYHRHLAVLIRLGFVVKCRQGGGLQAGGIGFANEYGIPGTKGALDGQRAADDDRYRRRKTIPNQEGNNRPNMGWLGGKNATDNLPDLTHKPSQYDTQTIPNQDNNHPKSGPNHTSSILKKYSGNTQRQPEANFSNDDDQTLLELTAASDGELAEALIRENVHRPRAKKLAGLATGKQIREAILTLRRQAGPIENPAGYLCDVLKSIMDEQAKAAEAVQAESLKAFGDRVQHHAEQIPSLPDEVLLDALERQGLLTPDMTADFIRGKAVWIESVAKHLARQELESVHAADSEPESEQQTIDPVPSAAPRSKAMSA